VTLWRPVSVISSHETAALLGHGAWPQVCRRHLLNATDDINPTKCAFYAACNSIFLHSSGINELTVLHLQETYSLSVLMYAIPALKLATRQVDELNACWN